jgi:hypothetical protein
MLLNNSSKPATSLLPGDGISIATIGSNDTFVSLKLRYLGEVIELVSELNIFYPVSGRTDVEEIARRFADDEDEAIDMATDMQRAARKRLAELDVSEAEIYSEPDDFSESLEAHFDRANARAAFQIAAE